MAVGMIVAVVIMVVVGVTVAVTVAAEDKESDEVGEEASGTDDKHQLGVADLRGLDESGQGFEDNGNAEGDEEDGVEEGTEDLSAHPTKGELVGGGLLRGGHSPETDDQGDDIIEHVEGISHQSQRVGEETGGKLEDEEGRVKSNHDLDAGALGPRHLLEEAHDEGRCAPATA